MSRFNHVSFFRRWTVAVPTTSALGVSLLAALAGCSSGPSRVQAPSISASGAASEAMTAYDKDGDGFIAAAELDAAPALKAAMATLDADKDGKVSEAEIQQRIEAWQAAGTGIMLIRATVTLDGKPLTTGEVTLEPEAFLGSNVQAAVGEIDPFGNAIISIPKDKRPSKETPPGVQPGFYKVKVSKKAGGQETIAAKYNAETVLGQQVATDDPAITGQKVRFELSTK
ncbi:hypothetical protein [Lacipirellula parvula]|uniref:EF-hand domain-containing protein n=1 Tax=Lacipirellula parvula TaxID=2650471 RepID=A0A5K7XEK6_9BACT|nr:hypothetical protein [Lacipirellula parvula]BBO34825.1 hypothetical protein PLANPX_4437 [Lacipirellula parvula]